MLDREIGPNISVQTRSRGLEELFWATLGTGFLVILPSVQISQSVTGLVSLPLIVWKTSR